MHHISAINDVGIRTIATAKRYSSDKNTSPLSITAWIPEALCFFWVDTFIPPGNVSSISSAVLGVV